MIGNIMYLMAANSNRKSEKWAITMTKYFWAYRVISSWILLIVISIFATTKFDGPHIQSYAMRHQQTIENKTGLALFIFCWIATPIWQWVGAVIVFDFKNLSSVGRDVTQLIHDGKLLDAKELINIGTIDYDAEEAITALSSCDKVDFDDDLQNSLFEELFQIFINNIVHRDGTVFRFFIRACKNNQPQLVSDLLNRGLVNVDDIDECGQSAIFHAAEQNHYDVVWELVQLNANCNIRDNGGRTILHYVFEQMEVNGRKELDINIIKCLVENGNFDVKAVHQYINIKIGDKAEELGLIQIKNYLVEQGADGDYDYFVENGNEGNNVSVAISEHHRKAALWVEDDDKIEAPILWVTVYIITCQWVHSDFIEIFESCWMGFTDRCYCGDCCGVLDKDTLLWIIVSTIIGVDIWGGLVGIVHECQSHSFLGQNYDLYQQHYVITSCVHSILILLALFFLFCIKIKVAEFISRVILMILFVVFAIFVVGSSVLGISSLWYQINDQNENGACEDAMVIWSIIKLIGISCAIYCYPKRFDNKINREQEPGAVKDQRNKPEISAEDSLSNKENSVPSIDNVVNLMVRDNNEYVLNQLNESLTAESEQYRE